MSEELSEELHHHRNSIGLRHYSEEHPCNTITVPIQECLLQEGVLVIYAAAQSGSRVTKINLEINPSAESKDGYELLEGSQRRHGKIVGLRVEHCPLFIHFFRFASVSTVKNQPEDLLWQVAILHTREVRPDV